MSEIKNKTIEEKIKEATKNDTVMQEFLLTIIANEYKSIQYSKVYKSEIEKAIRTTKRSD